MQTDDLIDRHASGNSGYETEHGELHNSNCELDDPDSQPSNLEVKKDELNEGISGTAEVDVGNRDSQLLLAVEMNRDLTGCSSVPQVSVEVNETVAVAEDVNCSNSGIETENGCLTVQAGSPIRSQKRDGSPVSNSVSSVKKARTTVGQQQPSVHVMYNSLTRDSKQKLVELLQHWSEWHAKHCSSPHLREGPKLHRHNWWLENHSRLKNMVLYGMLLKGHHRHIVSDLWECAQLFNFVNQL